MHKMTENGPIEMTDDEVAALISLQESSSIVVKTICEQLYELYLTMTVADQVQYAPYMATVSMLVQQGQVAEAKLIVSALQVSTEDVTIQQQMETILS